ELIVTLFYGRDGEWLTWTPQGYYTGSPGADNIVGWQVNKGPENAADYVTADQLRAHLNRPDIIERAIILRSAEAAIREAPGTAFKPHQRHRRENRGLEARPRGRGRARSAGHAAHPCHSEARPQPARSLLCDGPCYGGVSHAPFPCDRP